MRRVTAQLVGIGESEFRSAFVCSVMTWRGTTKGYYCGVACCELEAIVESSPRLLGPPLWPWRRDLKSSVLTGEVHVVLARPSFCSEIVLFIRVRVTFVDIPPGVV